ncbi:ABC transporter ATP-binding protein [Herbiconiux ginsengi]|uniref:ABC-2 type transport system ATP-binding protein n=1 Tax=Herbiconiux ginsengi TaxID=381665 RepID=A0A1H3S0V2_9MICO|nr:ABC transporter ATP-binding protein [Herbiconiux ginsengi]SDZ31175.1 ABC-2 type transport system ATP-binding protein [Herbiconiux ginsengi]
MVNSLAIECDALRVRRGREEALHDVDLRIQSGSLVAVLGPSGSGKTTLLRSIVGAQRITGGQVTVLGSPAGSAALRRRVGYVTQEASVYDDLTVRQNLGYFRSIVGAPRGDVERVLDATGLADLGGRLVASLSGGQRSRVSLAAALLGEPELLVLDEPTVGLDPVLRVQLWNEFRALCDAGTTLLVSSHVMDEATRCDRLILLREGTVLADDTLPALLAATGATDAEDAFLRLVAAEPGGAA